jgi:hypothetical protein
MTLAVIRIWVGRFDFAPQRAFVAPLSATALTHVVKEMDERINTLVPRGQVHVFVR